MSNKEEIVSLLLGTNRQGIGELIFHMTDEGFFEAPCSTAYHLSCDSGLAEHTLNVFHNADKMARVLLDESEYEEMRNSVIIASLLHDLGKMPRRGKAVYIPNILKSGKLSDTKPYEVNKDLMYQEHEIMSVVIASKYIELTEEEENAILHHNGLWGKLDSSFSSYVDKDKLSMIIHFSDLWSSRSNKENRKGE